MGKKTWTDDKLTTLVKESIHMHDLMAKFPVQSSPAFLQKHIDRLELDTTHWTKGKWRSTKNRHIPNPRPPIAELLTVPKKVNSTYLRKRLVEEGILEYVCAKCGQQPLWLNLSLTLHLHHKNGDRLDNRLCNLEILCPNCHSQTDNYGNKARDVKMRD